MPDIPLIKYAQCESVILTPFIVISSLLFFLEKCLVENISITVGVESFFLFETGIKLLKHYFLKNDHYITVSFHHHL